MKMHNIVRMCSHYTITALPSQLENRFKVRVPDLYKPRFNAVPYQLLPVIANRSPMEIIMCRWGMSNGPESEKSGEKDALYLSLADVRSINTWEDALINRRCLILADSFYVWKSAGKKSKIPYRVLSCRENTMCFAGIWHPIEEETSPHRMIGFRMLLRDSYKPVNDLTEHMPVILEQDRELKWLNADLPLEKIIKLIEMEDWKLLKYYPVSPKLIDRTLDTPELIKPVPATDQFGNLSLFD